MSRTLPKPKKFLKMKNKVPFKKIAIIGNPISHSLSPRMQNAAFKALKLSYRYSKIELSESQLKSFFKQLKKNNFAGLNITIPFKEKSLRFVDQLSDEAKLIGAINTVTIDKNGILKGFNTDGEGYFQSLIQETKFNPAKKNIVFIGAGGAARAILVSLCRKRIKSLTIFNRTKNKAKRLCKEFEKKFPKVKFNYGSLEHENLTATFPITDLLINTSSIGLKGKGSLNLPLNLLSKKGIVSDIVYHPRKTALLKSAKKLKLKTHEGIGMLLHQGALAFQLWTKKAPPLLIMKKALLKVLP